MQIGSAFVGFYYTDCQITEANEANFAVIIFCQNFVQIF